MIKYKIFITIALVFYFFEVICMDSEKYCMMNKVKNAVLSHTILEARVPGVWWNSVDFSPDGKRLVSGARNKIQLWDYKKEECIGDLKTWGEEEEDVLAITFSPDGTQVAGGFFDNNNTIYLWNVETSEVAHRLYYHTGPVNSVAYEPGGKLLASASDDGTIRLWDINGRHQDFFSHDISSYDISSNSGISLVHSVDWSPSGKRLASGADDKTIKIWDMESRKLSNTLMGHSSSVSTVVYGPDESELASGSFDKTVKFWDLNTGRLKETLEGGRLVEAVVYNPKGTMFAAGLTGLVKLWDIKTKFLIKKLKMNRKMPVRSVAFSPDGNYLAAGDMTGDVRVWDLRNLNSLLSSIDS